MRRKARLFKRDNNSVVVIDENSNVIVLSTNVFCPTGKGGGIDPTCSPGKSSGAIRTLELRRENPVAGIKKKVKKEHPEDVYEFSGSELEKLDEAGFRELAKQILGESVEFDGAPVDGLPAERRRTIKIDGVYIDWQADDDASYKGATEFVEDYARMKMFTMEDGVLWKSLAQIVISSKPNAEDKIFAQKYNDPEFESAATGGDGVIVLYQMGRLSYDREVMLHEHGHNVASVLWGDTVPSSRSNFSKAVREEPGWPTEYAKLSKETTGYDHEDFAESFQLYMAGDSDFKSKFPKRYKAIEFSIKSLHKHFVRNISSNQDGFTFDLLYRYLQTFGKSVIHKILSDSDFIIVDNAKFVWDDVNVATNVFCDFLSNGYYKLFGGAFLDGEFKLDSYLIINVCNGDRDMCMYFIDADFLSSCNSEAYDRLVYLDDDLRVMHEAKRLLERSLSKVFTRNIWKCVVSDDLDDNVWSNSYIIENALMVLNAGCSDAGLVCSEMPDTCRYIGFGLLELN